jgi:Na+/proline symporter
MGKPKLRLYFNIVLAIIIVGYIVLVSTKHINTTDVVIYIILYFGLLILRDIIAPKKKRSDDDGND